MQNLRLKIKNCGLRRWRMIFLSFVFIFGGCAAQKRSCPPFATAQEASAVLQAYSKGLKPLKATGSCSLNYTDEKGKKFAQSFPVRIWFESSRKFCLYGDVMFDPKGVCFVVTKDKYWTYAKPFGMYVTGRIGTETEDYFANPAVLVDFLEPVDADCDDLYMADSSFAKATEDKADKAFNILMCRKQGCRTKKIFIDQCEHFVKKVEYLNCSGNPVLVVESDGYRNVKEASFSFPHKLNYKYYDKQKVSNKMQIKLDSVKLWQASPQQVKALFTPPDANSFIKKVK